jgi:hypothetical protein
LLLLTRLSLHWLELVLLRLPWGGTLAAGLSRTLARGACAIFVAGLARAHGGPLMAVLGVAIPILGRSLLMLAFFALLFLSFDGGIPSRLARMLLRLAGLLCLIGSSIPRCCACAD